MRKCIATVSLSGTLSGKLDAIAAARFDAIEVFENDLIHFQGSPEDLRGMAADRGLGIDLYQPFRDLDAATDEQFRRNLDRAERKFDIMETLGAPMMLVCSNATPVAVTDDARIAAQFHALADRAARRNLRIAFEALAWGRHVSRYKHAWSIVKAADHPHLGLALDSFHTLSLGDDPAGIAEIPGDKIFFMQLADAPRLAMDVLQWSRHYRCFPGQGQFDLARFVEYALIAGYTGPLSLEIFNDVFREAPGRRTAIDAMQSLLYLESQTRQRLTKAAAADPQSIAALTLGRIALFDPPEPPRLDGVAFLEFAVDKENEVALGGFLESLGFARAGRHRSKEVSLYRQGDINLVLNAEPDSFARAHFVEHGPSICAMSVTTDDSVRALNRATALNCPRFDSRIGPHELKIPAIRAPDGSLVYFVSAALGSAGLYEIDFDLSARPSPKGGDAGLTSIDHIAIGLPVEALDTWILFYRAVLGMQPGESLELSDPYGLIRSCGVASDNRAVRVVLNVSQSRSTLTARTVTSQGGASVHHIAFAASDIFATMEKLATNGARFVSISGNYYDDLLARFDLPLREVERMRQYNVLYERSGGGEYFHAYSEPFAGRFFFEIIQRNGDYDGYGALNAPARIASQLQHFQTTAHP
jgi:4-hydroxyphenylpyruvate dioxygenase